MTDKKSKQNQAIIDYIVDNVEKNPTTISKLIVKTFGLSRASASNYLRALVSQGLLSAQGNTKARSYALKPLVKEVFEIQLSVGLAEDAVWRFRVLPLMNKVKQNVVDLCHYCFTEILNNAIDHSASKDVIIAYTQTHNTISMDIIDRGVGIFEKIQKDFSLSDPRQALLELSKGSLTSDKKNHSGQGIFFTSRMVDDFSLSAGSLVYSRGRLKEDDWLIETEDDHAYRIGTAVHMEVSVKTERTPKEVFDKYQGDSLLSFKKAHVPIKLSKYPGEQLVSRSQAKRVLARFENFTEIILDFTDVSEIGQSFADEIFRVFKNAHPNINIIPLYTTKEVDKMIQFVQLFDENQKKEDEQKLS